MEKIPFGSFEKPPPSTAGLSSLISIFGGFAPGIMLREWNQLNPNTHCILCKLVFFGLHATSFFTNNSCLTNVSFRVSHGFVINWPFSRGFECVFFAQEVGNLRWTSAGCGHLSRDPSISSTLFKRLSRALFERGEPQIDRRLPLLYVLCVVTCSNVYSPCC
jgi:hypothetical protein